MRTTIVAVLGLLTLFQPGCERGASPSAETGLADEEPVVRVETQPVRRGTLAQRISAPGSVVALRESRIGAEVKGRIEAIFVEEGDRVEADAPLFQIDPKLYELAVSQAEAGLDVARAERRQIESDLVRAEVLRGRDVVSAQELDRLQTSLQVARAREEQADRALALAQRNLEQTLVRAPYAGSIAMRLEDEGTTALVQPQTIVLVLQETASLEARVPIPESQLSDVREGDPALLTIEGLPEPIRTEVASVGDSIDPATRTYLVTMRVPNEDHRLKAGVFAHVELLPGEKTEVLVVPGEAIRREEGRTRVLVVRDGRATAVPVKLGLVTEELAEVLDGVSEGERVIVGEAARRIAPGMRVRVDGDRSGSGS